MQAQPGENPCCRGSDVAKLQPGPQVPHLGGECQRQRETFGRISGEGGKHVGFRQSQHDRVRFGHGVAVIMRHGQGRFGETVACLRDLQDQRQAICQDADQLDASCRHHKHRGRRIALAEDGLAATDPMTCHPRLMQRCQQAGSEAIR